MSELADLKQELVDLTKQRARIVSEAESVIKAANTWYDSEATRLNRAIRKLEPKTETQPIPVSKSATALKPAAKTTPKRQVRFSLAGMEDWSPEDIADYKRLKGVTA